MLYGGNHAYRDHHFSFTTLHKDMVDQTKDFFKIWTHQTKAQISTGLLSSVL